MDYSEIAHRLLALSRRTKRLIAITIDALVCMSTVWAALYLRLEQWVWLSGTQWLALFAAPLIAIPIFTKSGLYREIFRYTGAPAMIAVSRACLIYGTIYASIFTFIGIPGVPRTVGLIHPVLLFLAIVASRAFAQYSLGGNYRTILAQRDSPKVLIYGAGASGRQLASAVAQSHTMKIVGFLDDDASLQGGSLNGVGIHDPNQVVDLVERFHVTDVLLAMPSASRRRRREILELLRPALVNVRTLPGLLDLAHGRLEISELRPVEIEDLLGRDTVAPDQDLLGKNVRGKLVLITGAGGSIGSELSRQILDLNPSALLLLDSSEYALYTIHSELVARREHSSETMIVPLLASVVDEVRMRAILSAWQPDTIYHAAAYKHVTMVEQNVLEGLKNNVFGTLVAAKLALECGVHDFVLISTDKAVRPTNVMGATKRFAELVLMAYASEQPSTRFSMVRFGNVLGSSGSVVPLFRHQINTGGPVTLTHREVTRYFMTIPEAAQLVIQAGAMASGGDVFVLDMGEPVTVYDLAVNMIELSGLTVRDEFNPDGDVEITYLGLRPGEKLYEELLIGDNPIRTQHERIMKAHDQFLGWAELEEHLEQLQAAMQESDLHEALALLQKVVVEYRPGGAVVDWIARRSMEIDSARPKSLSRTPAVQVRPSLLESVRTTTAPAIARADATPRPRKP